MVKQYEIYWISLDPTVGKEINKTRPGVVISPDASNKHLDTVLIAPLTSTIRKFPMRVNVTLDEKNGQVALDQIRCVDKVRLLNKAGKLSCKEVQNLKLILKEYLID
ncbi:type II toxin-antitoxin system PemK/MazF family toxin [Salegentibacter sp. F188]|uniref:mRNA interferase n=1 Tax=Autumnicola patrickiae TaxID=3075591 RepID=A0ABU3E480_9FLAO|nr:type II toxin-antitoxin system PemK/MazF family toxin [Salegentibacter sp. F188]MDT0690801.1 type II toxin-antitoxin system PemK/MazF family toxin [Salegentibacter sp. F188]